MSFLKSKLQELKQVVTKAEKPVSEATENLIKRGRDMISSIITFVTPQPKKKSRRKRKNSPRIKKQIKDSDIVFEDVKDIKPRKIPQSPASVTPEEESNFVFEEVKGGKSPKKITRIKIRKLFDGLFTLKPKKEEGDPKPKKRVGKHPDSKIQAIFDQINKYNTPKKKAEEFNKHGIKAAKAGDFKNARLFFRRAANLGSIKALNNLGTINKKQGNIKKAKEWYRKAAKKGSATAYYNLALIEEIDGNTSLLIKYLKKASEIGSLKADKKLDQLKDVISEQATTEQISLPIMASELKNTSELSSEEKKRQVAIVQKNPKLIANIINPCEEAQLIAIEANYELIGNIENPTKKAIQLASDLANKKRNKEIVLGINGNVSGVHREDDWLEPEPDDWLEPEPDKINRYQKESPTTWDKTIVIFPRTVPSGKTYSIEMLAGYQNILTLEDNTSVHIGLIYKDILIKVEGKNTCITIDRASELCRDNPSIIQAPKGTLINISKIPKGMVKVEYF